MGFGNFFEGLSGLNLIEEVGRFRFSSGGDQPEPDLFGGGLECGRGNSHKKAQKAQEIVPLVPFCGYPISVTSHKSEIHPGLKLERTVSGFGGHSPKRIREARQT